ncbi:MAG: non-canonical purine NTP pyrophosphatase [Planctomycetaceae bacterium]|jgi:XTP/dITP diphosphohydrolase|nr:non-canonical purine NTP pyrophosphatase [Planctomycetaceae bacterium]
MFSIVLGTNNRKKGIELAELLIPFDIEVRTLSNFENKIDVVEDGTTFSENARKKASAQAQFLNAWVIGEDSGLSVDALGGAPGVYSARYAVLTEETERAKLEKQKSGQSGKLSEKFSEQLNASDEDNNRLLLEQLGNISPDKRTAHYTCAAALADPAGNILCEYEQYCRGKIRFEPAGIGGFGYDPLFEIAEYHRTFGELAPAVKRAISHRARTMRLLIPAIIRIASKYS